MTPRFVYSHLPVASSPDIKSLFGHPKLIHVPSGKVVERWRDIPSGAWAGCITHHLDDLAPTARDPAAKRLAVAAADGIHILTPDLTTSEPAAF